jgi:hypothetical protein
MEPWRLKRWRLVSDAAAKFYPCARPGRSRGSHGIVSDQLLHAWVKGLPVGNNLAVVSLLGTKPDGTSEYSFYSFYREGLSFQDWLEQNYRERAIQVLEHPTCDFRRVKTVTLEAVASDMRRLMSEGTVVVLVNSGGLQRTGQICRYIGATEDFSN